MKIKNVDVELISNSRNESTFQVTVNNMFTGSSGNDGLLNKNVKEMPGEGISIMFLNKILNKGLNGWEVESFRDILEIEELLMSYDGTKNLGKVGSNLLLALDYALLKLASNNNALRLINKRYDKVPLHILPCAVTNYTEKSRRYQEFYLIPKVKNFNDSFLANSFVYARLKNLFKSSERTDDGSFITQIKNENALYLLEKIAEETTKKIGVEFSLGLNINSENIFTKGIYRFNGESLTFNEFINEINKLINKFDLDYLEDPLDKDSLGNIGKIKGDFISGNRVFHGDLDNIKRYAKYFNCGVLRLNEVGSLTRLKKITDFCKNNDISLILEQNLGETNETAICDIAVGYGFDFVKYGLYGKERILKLHELKRIEQELV